MAYVYNRVAREHYKATGVVMYNTLIDQLDASIQYVNSLRAENDPRFAYFCIWDILNNLQEKVVSRDFQYKNRQFRGVALEELAVASNVLDEVLELRRVTDLNDQMKSPSPRRMDRGAGSSTLFITHLEDIVEVSQAAFTAMGQKDYTLVAALTAVLHAIYVWAEPPTFYEMLERKRRDS